ncbi:MAG: site-specific integrase, partial [Desulfobulbaceae bacterium]|nr:site-specific integrase [Desulfobulbaceae bacterium]
LSSAREKRDFARKQVAEGINPSVFRKEVKVQTSGELNFEAVAREWHKEHSQNWETGNTEKIKKWLESDVFPIIGSRPIAEITPPELLVVLKLIVDRGAAYTASRIKIVCGQVFRYAVATGRVERDPTADLKGALAPIRTVHRPALTEPRKIAPMLRMIDGYDGSPMVTAALRLLPLLFVRPGELRKMLWEDIDLEMSEWSYLINKTKTPHIVPLAHQALSILQELHKLTGPSGYVFPSARTDTRPMSDMAMNAALRRMGIDTKTEITGHGFRAMARTILDEQLNYRPELIEHQLAHCVKDPLGRAYNRTTHLPERKRMMQQWADYLDTLKSGAKVTSD